MVGFPRGRSEKVLMECAMHFIVFPRRTFLWNWYLVSTKEIDVGYLIAVVCGITVFLLAPRKVMSSNINVGFKGLVLKFMRGKKV